VEEARACLSHSGPAGAILNLPAVPLLRFQEEFNSNSLGTHPCRPHHAAPHPLSCQESEIATLGGLAPTSICSFSLSTILKYWNGIAQSEPEMADK
jgi:hypothetical protein